MCHKAYPLTHVKENPTDVPPRVSPLKRTVISKCQMGTVTTLAYSVVDGELPYCSIAELDLILSYDQCLQGMYVYMCQNGTGSKLHNK